MHKILLLSFIFTVSFVHIAQAEQPRYWKKQSFDFGKRQHSVPFDPYLENSRHSQIPQWEDENWYVEDWLSQEDGMSLIKGFYDADILRDQKVGHAKMPILVVGPNFYHLSGFDKRRVTQTIDTIYGISKSKPNGSFFLEDWYTKAYIGTFDENGLRLY